MPGDTPADFDDEPFIRAAQAGDSGAFETLVDQHLDPVRAFIALRLPVAHVVDELTHETFVFAFRQLGRFTAGTSLRAWLRAIAANLIRAEIQRFRRGCENQADYARYRLMETELDRAVQQPARELEYLQACIEELPESMRELIALKYGEDLSCAGIATRLQRTETWVWQNLFRVRRQLRQCVEGRMGEESP